jgi:hypothetical protein
VAPAPTASARRVPANAAGAAGAAGARRKGDEARRAPRRVQQTMLTDIDGPQPAVAAKKSNTSTDLS